MGIIEELKWRELISDCTNLDMLQERLCKGPITLYCGFDPTADSLHVGHLFVLISMARLQRMGHKPIAVLGGATGMIGDPSGKSKERVLLTEDVIQHNVACIKKQIGLFLDFDAGAQVVNNMDWFRDYKFIPFLRDVGKLFRVTEMMNKESITNYFITKNKKPVGIIHMHDILRK